MNKEKLIDDICSEYIKQKLLKQMLGESKDAVNKEFIQTVCSEAFSYRQLYENFFPSLGFEK